LNKKNNLNSGSMKALQIAGIGSPLQLRELPVPQPGYNEVLVRIKAAGICHSDVHYRCGVSKVGKIPITPGHEIAGVIEEVGTGVEKTGRLKPGQKVALHYLISCGSCYYCTTGNEQFCLSGKMIGKHCDGGYAEYITVPARNAVPLPEGISFMHGAVMMCSTATSFHALRKGRLRPGEKVAVFGIGGLGISAVQLAGALGAFEIYVVDINQDKLKRAENYGAVPVDASSSNPVDEIMSHTKGRGVDVALELAGLPVTMLQAIQCLAVFGRAVFVGITDKEISFMPYHELMAKEAEIIGANDHLLSEIHLLFDIAGKGKIDLSEVVTRTVSFDEDEVNNVMDELERFESTHIRTVITF